MPWGLKHFQQSGQLHFLTFSCYRRRPNFASPHSRACFESSLERVRQSYGLCVYGYVVMPEHVHLLVKKIAYRRRSPYSPGARVAVVETPNLRSRSLAWSASFERG
jgi:REP element-mobilizing transposase RayT